MADVRLVRLMTGIIIIYRYLVVIRDNDRISKSSSIMTVHSNDASFW